MFSGCPSDYTNLHFIVYIKVMFVVLKGNLLDENLQIALKGLVYNSLAKLDIKLSIPKLFGKVYSFKQSTRASQNSRGLVQIFLIAQGLLSQIFNF